MILLLNSAVMPDEGMYTLQRISETTFKKELQDAAASDNFRSYIGYPETAQLIEQLTDVEITVSRAQAALEIGDVMLIVKLRHRVADPSTKMALETSIDDFEFYRCEWKPLTEGEIECQN